MRVEVGIVLDAFFIPVGFGISEGEFFIGILCLMIRIIYIERRRLQ